MELEYTNNGGIFSDHYLRTRLPQLPAREGDYGPLRTRLSTLLREKKDALPHLSQAQTEQQFMRPVLDALCGNYETQNADAHAAAADSLVPATPALAADVV